MTEQVNVSESAQNQNSQPTSTQNISPGSQPAEKLLRQSEVNDLVGSAKHTSYEKGKQDALAEWQKQQQPVSSQPVNHAPVNTPQPLTTEQQQQIAQQAAQMLRGEQAFEQFKFKMNAGSQKYSDFEKVVSPLQINNIPDVVRLANGFENTADIMYDLAKNPIKAANLTVLHQISSAKAYEEMQNLSDSIKKNEAAKANQKDVREPLSQIKSSNVGEDNGRRTIADIRRDPRYRV